MGRMSVGNRRRGGEREMDRHMKVLGRMSLEFVLGKGMVVGEMALEVVRIHVVIDLSRGYLRD